MGKALLIVALGFSTLFGTITLNMSRHSLESVRSYGTHYANMAARNAATSGVYMALSKLCQNINWRLGFSTRPLSDCDLTVDLQDNSNDPTLSPMVLRVLSTSNCLNVTKTIEVLIGIPPDLGDLAVFATDTVMNVTVRDSSGNIDSSLFIQNAPDMLPFDKDGLVALANSQGHVIAGDFSPPHGYPNNSFYWDATDSIPNVIHVQGDLIVPGGTTIYGIYVVEGNADLNGSARLEGVLYLPNPGSTVMNGGGDPSEAAITGGIFANGVIDGKGNHITIRYKREYMEIFEAFQIKQNMFIVSWKESPDS